MINSNEKLLCFLFYVIYVKNFNTYNKTRIIHSIFNFIMDNNRKK